MATIVYKNAKCFINDSQIDAQLSELTVDYKAEMLDQTTFGNDTRVKKGGLYLGTINGKGYVDTGASTPGADIDTLVWTLVGTDAGSNASGNPNVVTVFPDGITEGSLTNMGYACKGVVESLMIGGGVGILLPLTFAVQSRGVFATA